MPIELHCQQCQAELQVSERAIGKKARCPRCGMINDIPLTALGDYPEIAADPTSSNPLSSPAESSLQDSADEPSQTTSRWNAGDATLETVYRAAESPLPASANLFVDSNSAEDNASNRTGEGERLEIPSDGARWSMKTPDGEIFGPVSQRELDEWAAQGRISAACLVQLEGNSHWQSAVILYPELSALRAVNRTSSARNQPTSAIDSREYMRQTGRYPTRGDGIGTTNRTPGPRPCNGGTVLALAVVSLFFTFFPLFAIVAFFIARAEYRAIESREASEEGRGMLDIGYAITLLSLAVSVMLFFGCCVLSSRI